MSQERVSDFISRLEFTAHFIDTRPIHLGQTAPANKADDGQLGIKVAAHEKCVREHRMKGASDCFELWPGELEARQPLAEQPARLQAVSNVCKMVYREQPSFARSPRQK